MAKLSPNAIKVLERRYFSKDEHGNLIEDAEGMFRRVAKSVAAAEAKFDPSADCAMWEEAFFSLMDELKFMPNSPTLMNAGKPLGQLSACFVLPVGDSMEEIFDSVKNAALIHKSGGGTGFSFSRLRPEGSAVRSTGGVASGPVSFMRVFNAATEAVKQGGTRRGANMGILRVDHPDILRFIDCKRGNSDITNFNISVGLTESFMAAVKSGGDYELIEPRTKEPVGKLKAAEVFAKLVDSAWRNGEPGIIFLDRINRDNPVPHLGEIESTNPCGEQPLLPYESCNLGSINLNAVVVSKNGRPEVDYDELGRITDLAVRFLDDVIEINKYPLPQIEESTLMTRKIGLGVMGFADMLFKLGIPYDSPEGVAMAEKVMGFIQARSRRMSRQLAQERGVFPAWEGSVWEKRGKPMRNATTTTIAPTGTISIICGASSGIEPLFAISFVRNVMDDDELPEVNPVFEQVAKEAGIYSPELMHKIAREGTLAHMNEIPQSIRRVFVTAHDISPAAHIDMQAAFQRYTDNAVSKTVNFVNSATPEDVREAFMLAYESGCKGVTIYRDGSRDSQVLNIGAVNRKEEPGQDPNAPQRIVPRERPAITRGITEKIRIGCGNLYVTVNYDDQGICEVFANLGRAGGCPSQSEAASRLISIALRSGMEVDEIVGQLKGIRCHSTLRQMREKGLTVLSCPDAIGKVIEKVAKEQHFGSYHQTDAKTGSKAEQEPEVALIDLPEGQECCFAVEGLSVERKLNGECPECGVLMEHEGGCVVCRNCGYSKCG
ncbi:MAG: vitamin B12-dependent ribonucleotide reductase [Christensenellales bacterium]|jgi:ribonucleoside-diphosphate reductase alpha chain